MENQNISLLANFLENIVLTKENLSNFAPNVIINDQNCSFPKESSQLSNYKLTKEETEDTTDLQSPKTIHKMRENLYVTPFTLNFDEEDFQETSKWFKLYINLKFGIFKTIIKIFHSFLLQKNKKS